MGFAAVPGAGNLSDWIDPLRSGTEGLEGGGDVLPGVPALEVVLLSEDATREGDSFVENMRVRRSFTDAFSAGFADCSRAEPFGTDVPFCWLPSFGDLDGASTERRDGGCDDRWEAALAVSLVVDMVVVVRVNRGGSTGALEIRRIREGWEWAGLLDNWGRGVLVLRGKVGVRFQVTG